MKNKNFEYDSIGLRSKLEEFEKIILVYKNNEVIMQKNLSDNGLLIGRKKFNSIDELAEQMFNKESGIIGEYQKECMEKGFTPTIFYNNKNQFEDYLFTIMRGLPEYMVIDDPAVSKLHGYIKPINGMVYFYDLLSTNGSKVNNLGSVGLKNHMIEIGGLEKLNSNINGFWYPEPICLGMGGELYLGDTTIKIQSKVKEK